MRLPQRSHPDQPPARSSGEMLRQQQALALEQGDAFESALLHMLREQAAGEEQRAGEFLVAYAAERTEGAHRLRNGELVWEEAKSGETHVAIVVRDGADGRFVPGLAVRVTLLDEDGRTLGTRAHPFQWHPWLYHYGRSWRLPRPGRYTLRVRIEAPEFARHGRDAGRRFLAPAEVEFADVRIDPGRPGAERGAPPTTAASGGPSAR